MDDRRKGRWPITTHATYPQNKWMKKSGSPGKMTGGGGSIAGSFVMLLAQLTVVLWQVFVQYY